MNWLLDLFLDLVAMLWPWPDRDEDRSIVGRSKMDHQARKALLVILTVVALLACGGYWIWKHW